MLVSSLSKYLFKLIRGIKINEVFQYDEMLFTWYYIHYHEYINKYKMSDEITYLQWNSF